MPLEYHRCVRMGLNIKNVQREVGALAERGIKLETRMVECLQGVRWRSADDPYTVFSDQDRSNLETAICDRDAKRPVFLLTHIKDGAAVSVQSHDGQVCRSTVCPQSVCPQLFAGLN